MTKGSRRKLCDIETEGFINAIARKLRVLFRGYKVHDESIPQNGEEKCFRIGLVAVKQKRVAKKRYRRDFDFYIAFYPAEDVKDKAVEAYKWEEKMLSNFKTLTVGGSEYHIKNAEILSSDGVWQFVFSISSFVTEMETPVMMREIKQIRGVVNDRKK